VPAGQRGLRQSEALFQHVRNLPGLVERAMAALRERGSGGRAPAVVAVAASTQPRPVEQSYMPVFRAGETVGRSLSAVLGVPFVPVSHQEGHVWAGLWSAGCVGAQSLVALHASGGTTELFRAERSAGGRWRIALLGRTEDLNAGQFIDRVGVALGLPFPAGPHLERLAAAGDPRAVRLPVAAGQGKLSFSGPTTAALRALEQGARPEDVAAAVQECAAESLARLVLKTLGASEGVGPADLFLGVGGVLANVRVRARLEEAASTVDLEARFAAPRYSVDNAAGVAVAALAALQMM